MRMRYSSALPALLLVALGVTAPAHAGRSDAACKPVIDADKARAAAPAWHTKKSMNGVHMEIKRLGSDVYTKIDSAGWKKMSPEMAANIVDGGQQADNFKVTHCRKLRDETVNGVATTVWTFKSKAKDGPSVEGNVWIGQGDGLPYREEGETFYGTTTYEGVSVPALN
ncbi:MAG TPA: hypothetical protein VJM31_08875 [Vicinamibacterales bacterium]|nr:hypothetical protein [Vicinamibacterales bacterium]